MTSDKILHLINRLIVRTDAGELRWREWARPFSYQTSLPDFSVIVDKYNDKGRLSLKIPHYSFRVLDKHGQITIDVVDDLNTASLIGATAIDKTLLEQLYQSVERSLGLGRENVLDEILKQVG